MKFLIREILEPVGRRVGSYLGGLAVGASLVTDAAQVEAAVTLLIGLVVDLGLSHLDRKGRL